MAASAQPIVYRTIEEFYDAGGGRWSGESDYGGFNWAAGDLPECRFCLTTPSNCAWHRMRVCHVHDTGDWYAVDRDRVVLLGTIPVKGTPQEPTVYAYFADWAQGETPGRPLSWFQSRIEAFNGDIPEPQTCI